MSDVIKIRTAGVNDYTNLANFLSFEYFIHRHLDWRPSLEWLGHQPFLIAEKNNEIVATYASPPDIPPVTWVRLFACNANLSRQDIWNRLFSNSLELFKNDVETIAALVIEKWFGKLLLANDFEFHQEIIVMKWNQKRPKDVPSDLNLIIRPMDYEDLPAVKILDNNCFPALWQFSSDALRNAFLNSGYATIVEVDNQIIAYQISTESLSSAHLARLAVDPIVRGKSVGFVIIRDMLDYFTKNNIYHITVNTQQDNLASQSLYRKAGFFPTDEKYPVLAYRLKR